MKSKKENRNNIWCDYKMIKLINIRYIDFAIVAMDILIEGDAERKYRLVLDLSSENISVGRPATTVPDKYFLYIRQDGRQFRNMSMKMENCLKNFLLYGAENL